jgi:CubicO group peptidase (beta-lactamase class C family)
MLGRVINRERLDELLARARRDVDEGFLPSCQVALAHDGELVAFETYGDATNDQRYVVFSVTKGIVAAAVWLLIGDGVLDPSAPVADTIEEFATNDKHTITAEQLLTHTAGLPRAPLGPPEWADRELRLERFAKWRLNWEPGTQCEYHATSAHWVLAELIERLSGSDYRDFVHDRIADALGLHALRLGVPAAEQGDIKRVKSVGSPPTAEEWASIGLAGIEIPEEVNDETLLRFGETETIALGVPGAGAVSTAADVARFYQSLLHNPGPTWDPDVLADGTGRVRVILDEPTVGGPALRTLGLIVAGDDGLGVRRGFGKTNSPQAFGHAGAGGQVAWADPLTGVSFCFLTNGCDANLLREGRRRVALSSRAGGVVH